MTKYEKGDKVLILCTVDYGEEGFTVLKESPLENPNILGKLEDFMPKQEKIKMTPEEKQEFDELKGIHSKLFSACDEIDEEDYPNLFKRLFGGNTHIEDSKEQLEFARAWEHPELIEVVHKDVRTVKVAGLYLFKSRDEKANPFLTDAFDINNEGYYFTKSAIENINKEDKFKNVDLVAAWEDGE